MRDLPVRRLAAEFVVIVVGVLVALAVDQWRESVSDQAAEAQYMDRLLIDLQRDSLTVSLERAQAGRKASDLARVLQDLTDPEAIRRQPSLAWPNLARTFARPNIRATTFDELTSTGGLTLVRNEALRSQIGEYYRFAPQNFFERLDARRTSLAALVTRVFPTFPGAPDIAASENRNEEWAVRRDSAFFAAPNVDDRMDALLGIEFYGLVNQELEYARSIERIDADVFQVTLELMAAIRAEQEARQ
jgi:hypothetical protein